MWEEWLRPFDSCDTLFSRLLIIPIRTIWWIPWSWRRISYRWVKGNWHNFCIIIFRTGWQFFHVEEIWQGTIRFGIFEPVIWCMVCRVLTYIQFPFKRLKTIIKISKCTELKLINDFLNQLILITWQIYYYRMGDNISILYN